MKLLSVPILIHSAIIRGQQTAAAWGERKVSSCRPSSSGNGLAEPIWFTFVKGVSGLITPRLAAWRETCRDDRDTGWCDQQEAGGLRGG